MLVTKSHNATVYEINHKRAIDIYEEYLGKEATTLTEIGNKFQIRHFEADKQPITDLAHVDYLFFRMFALIDLFVKKLEE